MFRQVPPRRARVRPVRSRARQAALIGSRLAVTAATVTGLIGAGGFLALRHYDGQVARITINRNVIAEPSPSIPVPPPRPGVQNILLIGSDTRAGANSQGTQGTGASFVTGARSDTVILAHLYASTDQVELVSIPRDSYVRVPAYRNPQTNQVAPSRMDKLNSSFSEGGPDLLLATVENLTGVRVDHVVQIDFVGFKAMTDAVGGVDVCLTHAADEQHSQVHLTAGRHHLNGLQALGYVRQRYGLARGDLDRIARQQAFIGALVRKVVSAGTLLDPFTLDGFLTAATHSVTVDSGLGASGLRDLALRLRSVAAGGVVFATFPVADIGGYAPGVGDVVLLDRTAGTRLFDRLRADRSPVAPSPKPAGVPGGLPSGPPASPPVPRPAGQRTAADTSCLA